MTDATITPITNPDADREARDRTAALTGLRDLIDYLTTHPAVPMPWQIAVTVYPSIGESDAAGRADVDRIAELLGVQPYETDTGHGHYIAERSWGPVSYRAVAIPDHAMTAHEALMSYSDNFDAA